MLGYCVAGWESRLKMFSNLKRQQNQNVKVHVLKKDTF